MNFNIKLKSFANALMPLLMPTLCLFVGGGGGGGGGGERGEGLKAEGVLIFKDLHMFFHHFCQ